MDNGQVIRRALRVAEECSATVEVTIHGSGESFAGPVVIDFEEDDVAIGDFVISIPDIGSITFSR